MRPEVFAGIYLAVEYAVRIIAIGVVPENRRPSSGQAWLLLIFFVPVIGIALYLLIGSPLVGGKRSKIQAEANKSIASYVEKHPVPDAGYPAELAPVIDQNRALTSLPCVTGNTEAVHDDAVDTINTMARRIDEAQRYVHAQIYIMALDETTQPFFDALVAAAGRGVKVRVLFDQLGSIKYPGRKPMMNMLKSAGIEFYEMMPINPLRGRWRRPDLRNHRKLVVIDGVRGFMGSQNMIEPPYESPKNHQSGRHWIDTNIEITGPIVESLDVIFATDWYTETGERLTTADESAGRRLAAGSDNLPATSGIPMQLVPSGPGFPTEPNLRQFVALINRAKRRVRLVSPYFIPDESLHIAMTSACYRGVEVELYVSEKADQFMVHHAQRSYYQAMLAAGVRIFTYPKPAVLHTKMITIDDEIGIIGSSNMDTRSFILDYEIMILGPDREFASGLDAVIDKYRLVSGEINLKDWMNRPWSQRYLDNAMRLTSQLQ